MRRVGLVAVLAVTLVSRAVVAQFAQQGAKLAGTGATGNAWQGSAVAVSADGSTALVGGYLDNDAAGATWVFTRSGGTWMQQGEKLVGTGATGSAQQGWAVAISGDGNTAIIGGPADNSGAGAAWVFSRSGGTWSQQGSKLVGGGASGRAGKGWSVAISSDGNTAVFGGPGDNNSNTVGAGAIWVFTRTGSAWKQQGDKLVITNAVGSARLGWSVAISGDATTLIAGGPYDNGHTGAVWVFTQTGGKWTQQGNKLVGTAPTTLFAISANASVTATFTQKAPPCASLAVASSPSKGGDININTTQTCTKGFLPGTQVSLSAVASPNWVFAGWSGSGGWFASPSSLMTTFTLMGDATVTAQFVKASSNCQVLTLAVSPSGAGTATTSTAVNCSTLTGYTQGSPLLLTASPAAGWQFAGWSATAGSFSSTTSPITVFTIETDAATVTASFVQSSTACETLVVAASPTNAGSVSVNTPQNCSGGFTQGALIWLTSNPAPGWTLSGWSGSGGSFSNLIGLVADAFQGTTVALSADGNTAVVGGAMTASSTRSVWVFARSSGSWLQQGNYLATSGEAGLSQQAWSVACSGDGSTAVVAEPGDNVGTGAAWVFTGSAGTWAPSGGKLVGTGAAGNAEQGAAVALSADASTIVVGGPNDGGGAGAVWVFAKGVTPACTFALSPTSLGFTANGGRGSVTVAVASGSGCPWVAISNAPWITVTAGAAGTDNGQVNLAVSGNAGVARSGTVTIANQTLTIYQAGSDCSFVLSPTSASFPASGGSGTFTVTAPALCPWAATSAATWLHITGGATGLGTGTVTFAVDASTGAARSAAITVAAQSFAVSEAAYFPPVQASFTFAPANPVVGEPVQFTDASTGGPTSWTWNFGDGSDSNAQNPSHSYSAPGAFTVTLTAANAGNSGTASNQLTVGAGFVSWLPVVSHNNGSGGTVWRSDVGVLNPGTSAAYVQELLYAPDRVYTGAITVPSSGQVIVADVANALGYHGSAALQIRSDQSVVATSRTYDQLASGTLGQDYASYPASACLNAGDAAWLPQLVQNAAFRTNIALTNTGTDPATVTVTLLDGDGVVLASYDVALEPGAWAQENQPFANKAGKSTIDQGYAEVLVTSGAGIIASASVIDRTSGDPLTVAMVPAASVSAGTVWVPVVSHAPGSHGSFWVSDVALLNVGTTLATVQRLLHTPAGNVGDSVVVPPASQIVVKDVVGQFGYFGSSALEISSDQPLAVTSRTYTQLASGTVGQEYTSYAAAATLAAGQSAWLPQLTENAAYRTNISLTNTGAQPATVTVTLFDGAGNSVGSYDATLDSGAWAQENRPFSTKAHLNALNQGYAKVTVTSGAGIIATASVIDNVTNDPTTITMVR